MSDTTNVLEENFKKSMDKTHKCARTTCVRYVRLLSVVMGREQLRGNER